MKQYQFQNIYMLWLRKPALEEGRPWKLENNKTCAQKEN